MPDQIKKVLQHAEELFGQVLGDIEPYNRPEDVVHLLFFRRFTEWQYEYCRAIRALYEVGCFQGSIPVLRGLVEVCVAQILLHRDEDFSELFELLKGERVRTDAALTKIGWPKTQSDIYARLSKMTHPSRISAFLGRTLDFEDEPLKSLVAQKDRAGIAHVMLWTAGRDDEAAQRERWAFVALNTFDLAISSLFTLYGKDAPNCHWWPGAEISYFQILANEYPAIKDSLLWNRLPWQHSRESDLNRAIGEVLEGINGTEGL